MTTGRINQVDASPPLGAEAASRGGERKLFAQKAFDMLEQMARRSAPPAEDSELTGRDTLDHASQGS